MAERPKSKWIRNPLPSGGLSTASLRPHWQIGISDPNRLGTERQQIARSYLSQLQSLPQLHSFLSFIGQFLPVFLQLGLSAAKVTLQITAIRSEKRIRFFTTLIVPEPVIEGEQNLGSGSVCPITSFRLRIVGWRIAAGFFLDFTTSHAFVGSVLLFNTHGFPVSASKGD